jgi:hypothetical protein
MNKLSNISKLHNDSNKNNVNKIVNRKKQLDSILLKHDNITKIKK